MLGAVRTLAVVAVAFWLTWSAYRHVAVYALRRRVVVVTDRVLANVVAAASLLLALLFPLPAVVGAAVVAVLAAVALRWRGIWVVAGAPTGLIFERAGLVMRGMSFAFDGPSGRSLEDRTGRVHVAILASITPLAHVLRVHPARGINKVALFRANLRKFLVAVPRQRRVKA